MYLEPIKRSILAALRWEPLDHFQVAATLGEPPFRVRAELRALKRDRYVSDRIDDHGHRWMLTNRGIKTIEAEADDAA